MKGLIDETLVILDEIIENKDDVIKKMARLIADRGVVENYQDFEAALFAREESGATAVGYDFGLPHGKSKAVKKPAIAFARLSNSVIWGDDDDEEEFAKYVFMLAIPESEAGSGHINVLVDLSKKILDDDFRDRLTMAETKDEVVSLINS